MVFNLTCLTQEHDFTYANVKIGHFKSVIDVVDISGYKNIGDSWKEPDEIFKMEPTWHF